MYKNDASIVISTRNRANNLERLLNSLYEMNIIDNISFEVIVVDNGSSDNTQEKIQDFNKRLKIINIIENIPGKSRSLNKAIEISSGRIIMITDDDCVVSKEWILNAINIFKNNDFMLCGGRIELYDKSDLPITILTSKLKKRLEDKHEIFSFVFGANLAFGRVVYNKIGGFDHRLGPGVPTKSAEDIDFVYRAFKEGIQVIYEPDMLVKHGHGRRTEVDRFQQISNYSIGDGAISVKYILKGDIFIALDRFLKYIDILKNIKNGKIYIKIAILRLRFIIGIFQFIKITIMGEPGVM